MHLVYIDESGNTGTDLSDVQQPIFVLGSLIVPTDCWQSLESDLEDAIAQFFPQLSKDAIEIHAADLRNGQKVFRGITVSERIALRDAWLKTGHKHKLTFVYRSIIKKKFQEWLLTTFGPGITINPYIAAFPLVTMVANEYLKSRSSPSLGMLISDENQEIVKDVEKSIRELRLTAGPLHLSQIIEKGFFVDSAKSRILQLCDLCVFQARKLAERDHGLPPKSFDDDGVKLLEPLIHKGHEPIWDVLTWLTAQRKQSP